MIEIKSLVLGIVGTNCYIVYDENKKEAVLIDPAAEEERIISFLEGANLKPKAILLTHGHFDHILAVPALREKYQIPLYAAEEEREMLGNGQYNMSGRDPEGRVEIHDFIGLHDGDELELLGRKWKVLSTPGHTKGGVCFHFENMLFTGDTLFKGSIGRTDLFGGNYDELLNSLLHIAKLDGETIVYPGHGPSTTLRKELLTNPFYKGLI